MSGLAGRAQPGLLSWRFLVSCCAIVCLVLTLANRVPQISVAKIIDVRCNTPKVKIQHRDNDAYRWSAPVAGFAILVPYPISYRIVLGPEPLLSVHLDGCRYNRPPPVS
jgi:hypothetical protein